MTAKRSAKPRVRKRKPPLVSFVARFHENERAGLKCSCTFPDKCDGSRLVTCTGNTVSGMTLEGSEKCECAACPPRLGEHVTGCLGCEVCEAAVCASCGKRDPSVLAIEGESWTCSPECTRKTFTVAS